MPNILCVENLTKNHRGKDIIHDISFSVDKGEIVAVKGQTGSGKTTLLKLIAGVFVPTSGIVKICGQAISCDKKENMLKVGLLLREHGLYSRLTTRQYLDYFRKLYDVKEDRVDEVIRLTGLIDREHELIGKLSDCFAARIGIARTILHKPAVLLLDEPTAHLDIETVEILRKAVIRTAEEGAAVLLATSSIEEAQSMACRVGKLCGGRIEGWDNTEEAKEHIENDNLLTQGLHLQIGKIPARVNDRIILFNPTELTYVEGQEGQSLLHAGQEEFQCPLTLSELEEKLKPFGFFRSHRSYIVNLQRVREVIPWSRNSYSLVLDDTNKTTIPLSKNSLKELENILGM